MNIKVRNIPKEGRKGTTKLENLPEFCITMYGVDREAREEFMTMLDGLGVRWASGEGVFDYGATKGVVNGLLWVYLNSKRWMISHAPILWCEEHPEHLHLSLDHFKNLVEDYLYEHQ